MLCEIGHEGYEGLSVKSYGNLRETSAGWRASPQRSRNGNGYHAESKLLMQAKRNKA